MTEPNMEFTVEERAAIADHAANARLELGIDKLKTGEAPPPATEQAPKFVTAAEVNMKAGLAALKEAGLDPAVLDEVAAGKPVTAEERLAVENWQRHALQDKDWIRKLFDGDPNAKKQLLCASIVLSSEIR